MEDKKFFENLIEQSPNRRNFVRKLGLASAMATAAVTVGGNKLEAQSAGPSDADILQFALNLEYLEAEFYTLATTGNNIQAFGLTVSGAGSSGATTGGAKVNFTTGQVQSIALELANDERTHVTLLQQALTAAGAAPVAKPAINLNALGIGFGSQTEFLLLSRIFEDIGVTAYGGAAPLLTNKAIVGAAARILAVEAYHSGAIRAEIARLGISTAGTQLDGADHLPPPFGSLYFNTDSNALSEVRTPGQVLYLAYGGKANGTSGGFFPSGVNGALNASGASSASSDGATLTLTPNPIVANSAGLGTTTVAWAAPGATVIQVRIGSPTGALFTNNIATGSMQTGTWVENNMTFYLVDVSGGKAASAANVLATVTAHTA